jgi:hypothetical protein
MQTELPGMGTIAVGSVAVAVLGLFALACSSGSLADGPGVGGAGGSGVGGTGVSGTGVGGTSVGGTGVGGAAGTGLQLPSCVVDLLASCAPQGACTSAANDAGMVSDVCFASGVHVAVTNVVRNCGGPWTMTVTKADGSPCYTFEWYVDIGMACEGIVNTWKDATGATVATGVENPYSTPSASITCTASGEVQSCTDRTILGGTPQAPCCGVTNFGTARCTAPFAPSDCTKGACVATN